MMGWLSDTFRIDARAKLPVVAAGLAGCVSHQAEGPDERSDFGFVPLDREVGRGRRMAVAIDIDHLYAAASAAGAAVILDPEAVDENDRAARPAELSLC